MVSRAQEASAFDAVARDYDRTFTFTTLGRMLRARVWEHLAEHFKAGERVLDLACGTGEDAVWLAQRGVRVAAADASGAMLDIARAKAAQAGVGGKISFLRASIKQIAHGAVPGRFDGAFSNFGGINTARDLSALVRRLYLDLKPRGKLILVPMSRLCPLEILTFLAGGNIRQALRRQRLNPVAEIRGRKIPIYFPSGRDLRRQTASGFKLLSVESLGFWLPPTDFGHWVDAWPRLFSLVNQFDRATSSMMGASGDHFIFIAERKP
ncbi:MAG: hypothetical protein A3G41_05575 [Elusimicrobia bacterium RIFCSPLOWO2_12_FULL_59_9]|nr:MAG: hypothetical protein A3G41_05575 [Elusimicrobia bacterium RIFCSPLOWO2_12_FULL_59_9]